MCDDAGERANEDGTQYVVMGIGTCTDSNVVIPSTYNDLPVTWIADDAFSCYSSLTGIIIPESVMMIGCSAFEDCSNLTSINIPDSVTIIGFGAFFGCSSLIRISVSENNENYKSIDGNLYSKDGKTFIQYAIGKTETEFTIPDSVTKIVWGAFEDCSGLTSINIPDSVASIGSYAFDWCSSLTSITFNGTVAQWNEIEKGYDWCYNFPATEVVCNDGKVTLS